MNRPAGNGSAGRVLVVEDDEGIREMLKYNLSSAGFSVQEARDGAAGLLGIGGGSTAGAAEVNGGVVGSIARSACGAA